MSRRDPCLRLLVLPLALLLLTLPGGAATLVVSEVEPPPEQPARPLDEIIRHVAEKEVEYARAHALYRYRLSVKIQEIGEDESVVGEFEQSSDVGFDPSGRRLARLVGNPRTDLVHLGVTRVELEDLEFIPLFILSPEEIPNYDITYLTQERLDEVDTYLFRLEPKRQPHGPERFFEGLVWVDVQKLDIVRAHGRLLGVPAGGALKGYFRRVEIFREPVDDFLFPTYVRSEDVITVDRKPVRARLLIRFTDHQRVRQPQPAPAPK